MITRGGYILGQLIDTLRNESRPIDGHTDPGALTDRWNDVLESVLILEKAADLAYFDAADDGCPHEHGLYECQFCNGCEPIGILSMDREKDANCWMQYYSKKAMDTIKFKKGNK